MIAKAMDRAERIARNAQRQRVQQIAARFRTIFGAGMVEADEARILVRGRGLVRRWLTDPGLRFLGGGRQ